MDKRLHKIIDENFNKYNDWIDTLNIYRDQFIGEIELTENENQKLTYKLVSVLNEISKLCIKYGGFKDNFDSSKMYLHMYGPELIIKSKKTDINYFLGIGLKGLYLKTDLHHSDNLKNMDDMFWNELLKLKQYELFEYEENQGFSDEVKRKYPDLFKTYKGTLFLMFRRYFLDITEYNEVGDLGTLKVNWSSEEDFSTMISEMCLVFKSLYKINYAMWKITDLKNKKSKN